MKFTNYFYNDKRIFCFKIVAYLPFLPDTQYSSYDDVPTTDFLLRKLKFSTLKLPQKRKSRTVIIQSRRMEKSTFRMDKNAYKDEAVDFFNKENISLRTLICNAMANFHLKTVTF